jgi:hypothetical protein
MSPHAVYINDKYLIPKQIWMYGMWHSVVIIVIMVIVIMVIIIIIIIIVVYIILLYS